ncbi:MAG: hypothetical protein CMO80_09455 [Verrucomicrobiales bacterium]|nr:hypothetical protein [Verrucomicrobiales bacterium]|tara:strand:+ start:3989 stop:5278 length:1290 start_codon:yes stop_codon:yes gene_type:complete
MTSRIVDIKQTSRRSFLLSGSTALTLPWLESFSRAAVSVPPTRLIFCGVGYGFTETSFYPTKAGPLKQLTEGMSPLERHWKDITLIKNLTNIGAADPHGGSTSYLTCANTRGTAGKRFHNSISCDLLAGEHLGREMRYNSLVLASKEKNPGGHGQGMSLAWNKAGKPVSGLRGPVELYGRLFRQTGESPEQRDARLAKKRSILDTVLSDAKSLHRKVSKTDRDKLNEYFQSIREIETGLIKDTQWANRPKPKTDRKAPPEGIEGETETLLTYELIALALQTQQTSVVSYRQPVASVIKSMGMNYDPHALSHYQGSPTRTSASQRRDQKCTEMLAKFIDILKRTKEPDGSSLFDHSILSWGTNIRHGHTIKDIPAIITGKGGRKIRHSRVVALPREDTPLANLWLTLLQQAGVPIDQFSNSTGTLPQLLS